MTDRKPPQAPGWFRTFTEPEDVEFASVELSEPEMHISAQWARERSNPPAESDSTDPVVRAADGLVLGRVRLRDVMLGVAVASLLFGVFSIGFLSRGLVTPEQDPQLVALLERAVEPRPAPTAPIVPQATAAVIQPAAELAVVEPPRVVKQTAIPEAEAVPAVAESADAVEQPIPKLKLNASLTQPFARPTADSLKMPAGQLTVLSSVQGEQSRQCETGQCSGPRVGPVEGEHGTKIAWADSPDEAMQLARAQNRLVFMMHVSGNFERPGFT